MTLIRIAVGLAEPGRERGLLTGGIEMGNVAEAVHPEIGDAFPPFFCNEGCNRGGQGSGAVPEDHGADIQQPGKEHALQTEMAEEDDGIIIGFRDPIEFSLPAVAVAS